MFFIACSRASFAATSIGDNKGSAFSIKFGKRININRATTGQAELITGFLSWPVLRSFFADSVTNSAALATSKTSSNPISSSPVRTRSMLGLFLNCPYKVGAGSAIAYL